MTITTTRESEVFSDNGGYKFLSTTVDDEGTICITQDGKWVYISKDAYPRLLRDIRKLQQLHGEQ